MNSSKAFLLCNAFSFIVGVFVCIFIQQYFFPIKNTQVKITRQKGFRYTQPLLYYDQLQENTPFVTKTKESIKSYIQQALQEGLAQNISVYLRYPNIPDWTVINPEEKYSPASLLKVPVMMVYFHQAEFDPTVLTKTLPYTIDDDNQKQNYKPNESMEKGKSYSIEDLIRRMIVYSDDTAEDILTTNITQQDFSQVFDDIQIDRLNYAHQEDSMRVQTYAYFFRVLYNSSFLNPTISEQALRLLTQTTFTQGIVAGVPKNIPVAHKFGERYTIDTQTAQLHDCGIIYYPKNPYLLCVMTRGSSFKNLETILKNISQITYNDTKQAAIKN